MNNDVKVLREMAKILIVDELAQLQDDVDAETALDELPSLTRCQEDVMDTVPEVLATKGITLDAAIEALVPEMDRLIDAYNRHFCGSVTIQELAGLFGERVYTSLALQARGNGVSPDDDPNLSNYLHELGVEFPHSYDDDGLSVCDSLVYDAVYLIEEEVAKVLDLEVEA